MGGTTGGRTRLSVLIVLGTILVVLLANAAAAFDGKRQGIIFSVGTGVGYLTERETVSFAYPYEYRTEHSERVHHRPFCFQTRYGYAPTDQFLICWSSQSLLIDRGEKTWNTSLFGLGASYYFSPKAPSCYVGLFTGLAFQSTFFEGDDDDLYGGGGMSFSVGYEFYRHWEVDLTGYAGRLGDIDRNFRSAGVALQVRVTAY